MIPLAYKYVAISLLMMEINFCAGRLHIPGQLPVQQKDIKTAVVFPPTTRLGFAARVDTGEYSFSFAKGRLRFVTRLDEKPANLKEYLQRLSAVKASIDTNAAYRLATNWLLSIDVDLARLEKEHPPSVRQQTYSPWPEEHRTNTEVPLPLFDVKWGDWDDPVVDVEISGSGELLKLRQEDDSYSRQPVSLVKNVEKLFAIPDEDFLKYSAEQRSNLVTRFSAVTYSFSNNIPVGRLR